MGCAMTRRNWLRCATSLAAAAAIFGWVGLSGVDRAPAAGPDPQVIENVLAVQNRHTDRLLGIEGVIGTATGLDRAGRFAVKVYVAHDQVAGLVPGKLEGVPVVIQVTGPIDALHKPPQGGGGSGIDPKSRFARPVPIGVSTGNEGECSAGTIGCRMTDGANVYALSNNHVYALENDAPVGSRVVQPGRYDTSCVFSTSNVIGTLYQYIPIVFSTSANNAADAAVAATTTAETGNATPANGYGTPTIATANAAIGQQVQKYGRTTALTRGTVTGVNVIIQVGYSSGTARFVDQIEITANGPFLKAGDSGSLLVTNPGRAPVGLCFAGSRSGIGFANRIQNVIGAFGTLSIDGN